MRETAGSSMCSLEHARRSSISGGHAVLDRISTGSAGREAGKESAEVAGDVAGTVRSEPRFFRYSAR